MKKPKTNYYNRYKFTDYRYCLFVLTGTMYQPYLRFESKEDFVAFRIKYPKYPFPFFKNETNYILVDLLTFKIVIRGKIEEVKNDK